MNSLALCIPAYNAAAFLPRLLSSARKQVIPFDEIWVYDDCSTDDTAAIAKEFGATVISGDVNRGCSFGKNKLAAAVKSDWIHFHDADDELLPNFTTLAHRWLASPNCPDVVLFDYEWRDNSTNELLLTRHFDKEQLEKNALAYAITYQINPFCGLYRRNSFLKAGGYDLDARILYNEDKAFHIKLAGYGLSFSAESEVSIINYRIQHSMSMSNARKCALAQYYVLEQAAVTHGITYGKELSAQFFLNAAILAKENEWGYVKRAIKQARQLGYKMPPHCGLVFSALATINGFGAVWFREKLIRLFKPHLRAV